MLIKIIGTLIGALVLIAGLYYFIQEKNDRESRKIYGIISLAGGVVFAVMLALTMITLL